MAPTPDHFSAQSPYQLSSPPPAGFDRAQAQRETETHLKRLISIDTQNPPGNELQVARYLDSILAEVSGIERQVLEVTPGRANFVARLRATRPAKKPILVMAHMDIVGVDRSKWNTPPFEPTVVDNYLYGRGAIDDKGMLAATMSAMIQLAKYRGSLERDVILLATAAEEGGHEGIEWVVEHAFHLIQDAEFALNEGGRIRIDDGVVRSVIIQTTEKIPYEVVATAHGPGGHASVPLPANALAALARAVSRVHEWKMPARFNPTTRLYFSGLARIERDPEMKRAMEEVSSAADTTSVQRSVEILSREPLHNAVLRTGQALTKFNGGIRGNVIPSEGSATINVRIIPGEDIREVVREMNRVGGEDKVTFELKGESHPAPPASPVTTDLYRALTSTARFMAPQAVAIPFMSTGATDGAVLRSRGIPTYGILPMPLEVEDETRMHGDNERVPLPALGWAAEYLYRVLRQVSLPDDTRSQ